MEREIEGCHAAEEASALRPGKLSRRLIAMLRMQGKSTVTAELLVHPQALEVHTGVLQEGRWGLAMLGMRLRVSGV